MKLRRHSKGGVLLPPLRSSSILFFKTAELGVSRIALHCSCLLSSPFSGPPLLLFCGGAGTCWGWALRAPFGNWFSAKYSHILFSLLIAQRVSLGTSTHRLSIVLVFITTMTRCKLSFSKEAAKQGPAAGVTPVFTPLKPLPKSLFVLVQLNSLGSS